MIKSKQVNKWDHYLCELSKCVAEWFKDPDAKVGAVVFSKNGGDISVGYNGFPMGVADSTERLENPNIKLKILIHAEQNAIIATSYRIEGAPIFVGEKPVCARCAGSIIQAGIKRVVALSPESVDKKSKWHLSGQYTLKMFLKQGSRLISMKSESRSATSNTTIERDSQQAAPVGAFRAPAALHFHIGRH